MSGIYDCQTICHSINGSMIINISCHIYIRTGGHNITDHTLSASCTDCYSLNLPIQITVNPHIRKMIAFFYIFSKLTKSHNMGKLSHSSESLRLLPGSIGNCKHPCILKLQMICA